MAVLRNYTVVFKAGIDHDSLSIQAEHIIHKEGMSVFIQYGAEGNNVAVAEVPTEDIAFVTSELVQ